MWVQTELVQEQLGRHVQHLLKFGRATFDELQLAAVTADIHKPLLINAGTTCSSSYKNRHNRHGHLNMLTPLDAVQCCIYAGYMLYACLCIKQALASEA